jgi:hypothetical protein
MSTDVEAELHSQIFIRILILFTVEPEAHADYVRKRQHISTIETTSPSRSLLQGAPGGTAAYAGYCTLRNGMPLQDLNNIGSKPRMVRSDLSTALCRVLISQ